MILIGQYDSPFVRRVGIALTIYGIGFEHRPWSTFGDAEQIRPYNPLTRVPTLVLDDGDVLVDSHAILDHVDGLVPGRRRMFPTKEPARRRAMKIAALATGFSDKAVSLFYEKRLHDSASPLWVERCETQIAGVLRVLDDDRAKRVSTWWFGEEIGHADIAVACAMRHANECHPGLASTAKYPALGAHAARAEALPVFKQVSKPFIAPT
ncbi:MAG: glutathione S-transferase family protein [Rhizobiaceae bacterium]